MSELEKNNKKYEKQTIIDADKGKRKKVNFGAKGMPDWRSGTASKAQRKSFRARMMGIKRKDGTFAYKDKTSPAYWALNYLW